jgi:hypothetical protein
MGTLTPDETVREHNRGRKAAGDGRSRYWSERLKPSTPLGNFSPAAMPLEKSYTE